MSAYADDFKSWATYVQGELARFYETSGGVTYLFLNTPKANRHIESATKRGMTSEQAVFYGAPHMVRSIVTTEFRQWWIEHWGTERVTFTEWQKRAKAEREQVEWEDSADRALDQLDMLRRLTLERDSIILAAASKGASKVAIARSVGLSRQQVHTIIGNATAPDVAPFDEWDQVAPDAVEVAPADVWGEVF